MQDPASSPTKPSRHISAVKHNAFDANAIGKSKDNEGNGVEWRARLNKALDDCELQNLQALIFRTNVFWSDDEEATKLLYQRYAKVVETCSGSLTKLILPTNGPCDIVMDAFCKNSSKMINLEHLAVPFSPHLLPALQEAKFQKLKSFKLYAAFENQIHPVSVAEIFNFLPLGKLKHFQSDSTPLPDVGVWSLPENASLTSIRIGAPDWIKESLFNTPYTLTDEKFTEILSKLATQVGTNTSLALAGLAFVFARYGGSYDDTAWYDTEVMTLLDAALSKTSQVSQSCLDAALAREGKDSDIMLNKNAEYYSPDSLKRILLLPQIDLWKHRSWLVQMAAQEDPDIHFVKQLVICFQNHPESKDRLRQNSTIRGDFGDPDKEHISFQFAVVRKLWGVKCPKARELFEWLLSKELTDLFGFSPANQTDANGYTPLHYVAVPELFPRLKELSADPAALTTDDKEFTPLLSMLEDDRMTLHEFLTVSNAFVDTFGVEKAILTFNSTRAGGIQLFITRMLFEACLGSDSEPKAIKLLKFIRLSALINEANSWLYSQESKKNSDESVKVLKTLVRIFTYWRHHTIEDPSVFAYSKRDVNQLLTHLRKGWARVKNPAEKALLGELEKALPH